MTVNQIAQRQIFNWLDFDIGAGNKVYFDQKDASYTALNRIWSGDPSVISGVLKANGQVILINQNGIIFDHGAQVNVGSLVASSLNIGDKDFLNPIFSQSLTESAAFTGSSGYIRVLDGARLTTAKGGSIWLFAPNVTNSGLIQTEEGQVILAAGHSVFLQSSDDLGLLRGFLVEVNSGGGVTNTNLGQIIATRGNATLVGIAVNQNGRVSATTSAILNGSIRLLARDTYTGKILKHITASKTAANGNVDEHGKPLVPGVILGVNSETSVTPELGSGLTSADSQKFMPSTIDIYGHSVQVLDNAVVRAPSGIVNFTAANNPSSEKFGDNTAARTPDIHVYFAPGSVVDVSGTQKVALAMESNSIQANLQGAQLATHPCSITVS